MSHVPRLAVIFDAAEERWPSMDLVAEMLLRHLQAEHSGTYMALPIRPRFSGVFKALPIFDERTAWNADRLLTRFAIYPAQLVIRRRQFDLFHVADHSYAHLVHVLPPERTGVFCHDLDAFGCLLRPNWSVPSWRRAMARAQLSGLQRAAVVFYSTQQIRKEIEDNALLDPAKLVHAPYGIASEFFSADGIDELPPGFPPSRPFLLHVGNSMYRKRLDVLFRVFAEVRRTLPDLVLVQQGARLLPDQRKLVAELQIADALIQPPPLSRRALAALYHRAELVLLTSEREGFGLPILEALAGGAAVVASDIAPFRELAANAVTYCPVGDVHVWSKTIVELVLYPNTRPPPETRLDTVGRFTWTAHAVTISDAYTRLAGLDTVARA